MKDDNLDHLCCVIDNGEKLYLQSGDALPFLSHHSYVETFILTDIFKMYGNT